MITQIYDSIENIINENVNDYIKFYNSRFNVNLNKVVNIHREYTDIFKLPAYPSIVFGYGQISFDDLRPTTHTNLKLPLSLYAVCTSPDARMLQSHSEAYATILLMIITGELIEGLIVKPIGLGIGPSQRGNGNSILQVGYIDLEVDTQMERKSF